MHDLAWWQSAVIYEIYPRSFQDSNGDGIGDLDGIIQRLDYLVRLGVDAIWVTPMYRSPMADFGYDVADYCSVDPIFGTMQGFDRLLKEAHSRDLKLILDFVPNHSSDQHPWFLESRSSLDNAKRNWYLWRDEPNNWMSNFGGSGWEWDKQTNQYYYHSFLKEQPDLNGRNPAVRAAMYDVLGFWLEKGVDGFRVDVMWLIIKDNQYRNNPLDLHLASEQSSANSLLPVYNSNRPEVHDVVAEMRALIDKLSRTRLDRRDIPSHKGPDDLLRTGFERRKSAVQLPAAPMSMECTTHTVSRVHNYLSARTELSEIPNNSLKHADPNSSKGARDARPNSASPSRTNRRPERTGTTSP